TKPKIAPAPIAKIEKKPVLIKEQSKIQNPPIFKVKRPQVAGEDSAFFKLLEKATTLEQLYEYPGDHFIAVEFEGNWVTQGDLLVNEKKILKNIGDGEVSIVNFGPVHYWPGNVIPYVIDGGLNQEWVLSAIETINRLTHVRFVEHSGEADYVF